MDTLEDREMSEQTTIKIVWHTQITEKYEKEVSIADIAEELELTEEQVRQAHADGTLSSLIETDWLADFEGDDTAGPWGGYFSTDDRTIVSVKI
jgi:DNA-directed RNA polymerase specialized sigma subunit